MTELVSQEQPTLQRIKVLALTSFFVPAYKGGGPIRSLDAMATTHNKSVEMSIVCSNRDLNSPQPLNVQSDRWVTRPNCKVYYSNSAPLGPRKYLSATRGGKYDFLYLNTIFSLSYAVVPAVLWRIGLLRADHLLIAPRGQLGAGALALKNRKKSAFIRLTRLSRVFSRAIWHGSSEQEASEIRRAFPGARVVVRENEVDLPARAARSTKGSPDETLRLVYVGRVSEKKGIHTLLEALRSVKGSFNLKIYGDFDDESYRQRIDLIATKLPSSISVSFNAAVPNSQVREIFASSDYFAFPTSHENFGHTIVESLSSSCPVIIPDVTPLTDAVRAGEGVIVAADSVDSWRDALDRVSSRSLQEHQLAKLASGRAYERWRESKSDIPSVFELALAEQTGSCP